MTTGASTQILAISPSMKSELGHFFSYHNALRIAAESLNWRYVVAAPTHSKAEPWPAHWQKCLEPVTPTFSPKILGRLHGKYRAYRSLMGFLQSQWARGEGNIIFLEHFSVRELKMVINCLRFKGPPKSALWLLFRQNPVHIPKEAEQFRQQVHMLKKRLGDQNLRILSDTDTLASLWSTYLDMPVHNTPIPLAPKALPEPFAKPTRQIVCWWPGLPAPEKGLSIIQKLLRSQDANAQRLLMVAADTPSLSFAEASTPFIKLPTPLPEEDYLRWMATSDIILLPYNAQYYTTGSSGIFVQAISHGKIPLVHAGTWMASELTKYGLDRFIIDWERSDIPSLIVELAQDPAVLDHFKSMQAAYRQYHSIASFAQCMQQLHNR